MKIKSRKRFLKTTAVGMTAVMLMTMSPVSAEPKGVEDSAVLNNLLENSRESFALFKETKDIGVLSGYDAYNHTANQASKLYSSGTAAQEKFDLRNVDGKGKSYITPVKDQTPWGTCWGFSAIAMAESSAISEADKLGMYDTYKDLDLSELHLAWFARTPLPEDFPAQGGEGATMLEGKETQRLNTGGYPYSATSIFSSGIGPVLESDAPYKNGSGKVAGGNYAPDDTWNVPEGIRFRQYLEMEETKVLPNPNKNKGVTAKYDYNKAATLAIKSELVDGRAVSICFLADNSMPGDRESIPKYLNFNSDGTWAHYTYDEVTGGNHAVTIVGWDDTYSRENFGIRYANGELAHGSESQPPGNGAWIVKNSWGSDDSEFPNQWSWGTDEDGDGEGEGYFYLSYYDKSLELPETVDFDLTAEHGDSYIIDQHDLMPSNAVDTTTLGDDIEVSMANVFTAEEGQEVYAISTETATPGTKVSYELYRLNESFEDSQDPRDGKLLEKGTTKAYEYGGYHKIPLKGRYRIPTGQKYSIVITLNAPLGTEVFVDKALSKSGTESINELRRGMDSPEEEFYTKGVVNPGESYLSEGGEWLDWADYVEVLKAEEAEIWDIAEGPYDYDNFSIKAYADPDGSSVLSAEAAVADEQEKYYLGEEVKYDLTVTNNSGYDASDINITYNIEGAEGGGYIDDISAGKSASIEYIHTVTKEDVKRGTITNEIEVANKEGDVWTTSCTVNTAKKTAGVNETDENPQPGDGVDSGDTSNMTPWIIVMILTAGAIVALLVVSLRKKGRKA